MLADWIFSLEERVDLLPAWVRPPIQGVLLVYGYVFLLGRVVVPLALLLALAWHGVSGVLLLLWVLAMAGLAGFAGGVAWALVHPPSRWLLGRFGRYPAWWMASAVYFVVLLPGIEARDPSLRATDIGTPQVQLAIALAALIAGSTMAWIFREEPEVAPPQERRDTRGPRRRRRRKPASF